MNSTLAFSRRALGAARHALLLLLLCTALTACITMDKRPALDNAARSALTQRLQKVTHWRFDGRVSLSTEEESWHGSIHWRQQGDHFHIRIIAPLGQKTLDISGDRYFARIKDSNGEYAEGSDIEQLVARQLGWRLPLYGLLHWVKAVPAPQYPLQSMITSEKGMVEKLRQADWLAEYRGYRDVDDVVLPVKIFMENDHFKLRLAIRHWVLEKDASS